MSWKADQIYTKPNIDLINYLSAVDGFSDELFLVNNLEGIRSEFTKNEIFSIQHNEHSHQKHTLPAEGFLVIKPKIYKTGYDINDDADYFWDKYQDNPIDKWAFIPEGNNSNLEFPMTISASQRKLFSFLHKLNNQFEVPFVYYYCVMWGGEIEEEYAIIFDKEIKIYQYDYDAEKDFQLLDEKKIELDSTILQTALKYLDLDLPTYFFALHESSFNWKKYHVKKG